MPVSESRQRAPRAASTSGRLTGSDSEVTLGTWGSTCRSTHPPVRLQRPREQIRRQTYGDDLGQSGLLTMDELERFAEWLDLGAETRLLDVGCGAGGPALRLA